MMVPSLPSWGDPVGLAFFFIGLGIFFWGFSHFLGANKD